MKCLACGETIPDNSRFCNICGVRVSDQARGSRMQSRPQPPEGQGVEKPPPRPKSGSGQPAPAAQKQLTRAEKLQQCLHHIIQVGDLPAFSHHINEAMGMLGNDDASLRRLTNIILRDYGLLLAVMRRANSTHYNRSGKPISSVTHAVAMLGSDAVRNVASGLLLLEHFGKQSANLRALMLLSSLTANQVRILSMREGFTKPEEAYVCGMFHDLGEVLVASCFPQEHAAIRSKMGQKSWSENEACVSIMGFSFEDLGKAMTQHWKMPPSVGETMHSPPLSQLNPASPRNEIFSALVAFCSELTREVFQAEQAGSQARVRELIQRYHRILNVDVAVVRDILNKSVSDTKESFDAAKMPLDELRLRRRTNAAIDGEREAEIAEEKAAEAPQVISGVGLLQSIESDVSNALESGTELDMNKVLLTVLEAVYRGGDFNRALFCLTTPDRSAVRGRFGLGEGVESILQRFQLSLSAEEEPLAVPLLKGIDLYVSPENMQAYSGSRLVQSLEPPSFGVFPITIEEVLVGCIYFDGTGPTSTVDAEVLRLIGRLRDCAATAIRRSRRNITHG